MLVHKSLSPAPPFNVRYRIYGDWDFNLRLWLKGAEAKYSPALNAYADPGGASSSRPIAESFLIGRRNCGVLAGTAAVGVVIYCAMRDRLMDLANRKR